MGEKFHRQGARWRFPKDLELSEVRVRIGRIKELWKNLERVPESGCAGLVSTPLANEVAWFTERPWRTSRSRAANPIVLAGVDHPEQPTGISGTVDGR